MSDRIKTQDIASNKTETKKKPRLKDGKNVAANTNANANVKLSAMALELGETQKQAKKSTLINDVVIDIDKSKDNDDNNDDGDNNDNDDNKTPPRAENKTGGRKRTKLNNNKIKKGDSQDKLKYPKIHTMRQSRPFYWFQFIMATLSFVMPAVFTFFDNIYSTITWIGGIFILIHTFINVVLVFDNLNPPEPQTTKYLLGWLLYEFVKITMLIVHISLAEGLFLINPVLIFMIIESISFYVRETELLRRILKLLLKHAPKIGILYSIKLLFVALFSYVGYIIFKDAIHREVITNDWIEGNEFDTFQQGVVTLLDINDWFNSYLVRALENQIPSCTYFYFIPYVFIVRCVIDNLILVFIVQIFTDQETHKLALAIKQKINF